MIFTHIKNNSDGSADYLVDLTDEEAEVLVEQGIIAVLKASIRKHERPAGYQVGEKVFATEHEAMEYKAKFVHHKIKHLYV